MVNNNNNKSSTMKILLEVKRHDPIEITIMLVRAMGPVTVAQIERELLTQCTYTKTPADAGRQARKAIAHGLEHGWLVKYDEESYDANNNNNNPEGSQL